jgi:hypothetical protein
LTENRKRRRSSASSADKPFQQLLKGFENVVHEKALLMAEVTALRAENQHQKKRARKTGSTHNGGSIAVDDSQEVIQERRVREQSDNNDKDEDPVSTSWPPRRAAKMVLPMYSKCGKVGHNIKFCSL